MTRMVPNPQISTSAGPVRPPWATEESVRGACTSCGACIDACPEAILVRGRAGTPVVDVHLGACTFCRRCAEVCGEGVFGSADQAPWSWVAEIGAACLLGHNVSCQSCLDACDDAALRLEYRVGRIGRIDIDMERCTGCGGCVGVCPTRAISLVEPDREKAA